mgnify:CR=1 FL=1
MSDNENMMEKIVSLAKRRGFTPTLILDKNQGYFFGIRGFFCLIFWGRVGTKISVTS